MKGFRGLIWAQALGAFNVNAFKTLLALWAAGSLPTEQRGWLAALAGGLFVLPLVLLSPSAGALCDRCGKRKLIVLCKAAELALMASALAAFAAKSVPLLLGVLLLLGAQGAFFGTVRLAILPDILEDRKLSHGNGLMQAAAFSGVLLGAAAAGLIDAYAWGIHMASGLFVLAAAAGVFAGLRVPDVAPAGGLERPRLNAAAQVRSGLGAARGHRGVLLALAGSAYFWFVMALLQAILLVYAVPLMGLGRARLWILQAAAAAGVALGSYAAGRLSREQVELGLVPVGALGMVAFSLDLAFSFGSGGRTLADLVLFGASAGCFVVPLHAFAQQRSPKSERGRFIGAGNAAAFFGVLAASSCAWLLSGFVRPHPGLIFLVLALATVVVAAVMLRVLPDFLLRLGIYPIANLVYRIEVEGGENVPLRGPALLVANHVSHVDAVLISGATRRLVRFMMYRDYYHIPVLHQLVRTMGCIPISQYDSPKAILGSFQKAREELERGEVVCIFAEGQITRHGQMLPFKKGFERIVKGLDAPIVPVHLDRVWGSIFSFERGRFLFKRPRRIPYPVTVSFGRPMGPGTRSHDVRQAILELSVAAFRHRLAERPPLPEAFVREAKRHPFRLAMADSTGRRLSYLQAMAGARATGRAIVRSLPPGDAVGLLLPPSVGAALANIGVAMMGKTTVNLNYTAPPDLVARSAAKAGVSGIVTSRRFLEAIGWEPREGMVFLEDLDAGAGGIAAAAMLFLPAWIVIRLFVPKARGLLDRTATVIFTSGSTGTPKGAMLSHANVHANIEALGQIYQVNLEDRVLGVLPFFHAFGHTGALWFPLLAGMGVVYHSNPLDARVVGALVERYRATFLLATPTFLLSYLRRVEPERFRSLRYVVVGAEKLREDVARAFEKKFDLLPLEGYGCTELSPAAAVNIPDFQKPRQRQLGTKLGSIGHPLPGVLMKVVDPETGEPVPPGRPGLLLVKGPNVMKGYVGEPEETAEVLRDGYYVTGDIAALDEDGFVTITDRIGRFSKIGGEMVPHIAVEEKLHELAGRVERTFIVTGVPDEERGERLLVLCKGYDDFDGLCRRLRDSGLPRLWTPDRDAFHAVPEFPLLGSGKLDMRGLGAIARGLAGRE
ncbi:MAG: MFS transporter [Elusimicrobiota bacterium]